MKNKALKIKSTKVKGPVTAESIRFFASRPAYVKKDDRVIIAVKSITKESIESAINFLELIGIEPEDSRNILNGYGLRQVIRLIVGLNQVSLRDCNLTTRKMIDLVEAVGYTVIDQKAKLVDNLKLNEAEKDKLLVAVTRTKPLASEIQAYIHESLSHLIAYGQIKK